ncbi:hypothetical protein N7520_003145 [Penicillium odoratum]|uniref:uncharacterized protein n=1 Tax=Penicillium odoratum TaxID=1167516 RepID=UPI0025492842|nr:uncharacterized protein N7520_003145 [Penicillium odoratum]KAJ5772616.1 hypothetical protein N7520_003145 [Penicillium odoratum]
MSKYSEVQVSEGCVGTLNYLAKYPEIPAPKILRDWGDSDGRYFILQELMKGQTLEQAWGSLSETRNLPSRMKWLKFAISYDPSHRSLYKVLMRVLAILALESLKNRLPKCEPNVLTHCDLNLGNIMVKDGVVTGILDCEVSAYYHIWYEYVSASWGWTEKDTELKKLFQERLDIHEDRYPDAKAFWKDLRLLRKYENFDDNGHEIFK